MGAGKGEVTLTLADQTYTVVGDSQSGGKLTIAKDANGKLTRTCDQKGDGACPSSGSG